ncbi:protein of unknown function [Paraburkholderia kururiensis]
MRLARRPVQHEARPRSGTVGALRVAEGNSARGKSAREEGSGGWLRQLANAAAGNLRRARATSGAHPIKTGRP